MYKSLILCVLVTAFVGCGESNPPTEEVTGVVTLDGKPVEGATITFTADDAAGESATGKSGVDGKYTLTTFSAGDGAMAGSYKITVKKFPEVEGSAAPTAPVEEKSQEDEYAAFEQGYTAADAAKKGTKSAKNQLPAKYESAVKSGLTATVVAGGENNFDLELKSK